ncbi:MAG: sigma 54-interacting transcriptional regulator [Deltaproteobacteria bacterium]|nr:sigma 54-interacting transcriptional regulator [Deltaproteobacteria bacterium]MDQ3296151.1 sigma 54-interacting transcriptional regulator [Myxococcota bacterium]
MNETNLTALELRGVGRARAEADRMTLVVLDGEGPEPSTRVIEVPEGGQVAVGRSRSCDVRIDSERVSRTHAVFVRRGRDLEVSDAGSRNGTFVNGVTITGAHRLSSGDEVAVGGATLLVNIASGVTTRARLESTRYLEERLAAEVDRGLHFQRRFGLVLLQLDGPTEVTDDASDRIASALRPMDVLAEYAPGVLAIVMPELSPAALAHGARLLLTAARTQGGADIPELRGAIGIAAFPDHSTSTGGLISRARAALEAARRSGHELAAPPDEPNPVAADILVGDPQMVRVYELVRKVADHPITVLITGETGVGKEVVAAALHAASRRRQGPFVRLNCASLPETLLESELFGHEKGAFTGADRRKTGFFEAAHGGTLFLDEIGEMTALLQAKLLRVLEQRCITRVGGTEEIAVDVRVLCATHRDLEAESRRGNFRSDLFFRISGFTILIPPLRTRPDEIELFAKAFIQRTATALGRRAPTLSPAATHALRRYAWPGNVRELGNTIERAMVLHSDGVIQLEDLPDSVREGRNTFEERPAGPLAPGVPRDVRTHIADLERDVLAAALEAAGGNQTEAAKQLGLTRRTLIYRMEKHGLKMPPAGTRK